MKIIRSLFVITVAFIALITAPSCSKDSDPTPDPEPESIFDLPIPDGFNFETTQDIQIELKATNNQGNPFANLRWQIYNDSPENDGQLIAEGSNGESGMFKTHVSIPSSADSLFIGTNYGGIGGRMFAITGGKLLFEYEQPNNPALTKSTSNGKGTSYFVKKTFDNDVEGFSSYRDDGDLAIKHSSHPENPLNRGPFGENDGFMWGYDTEGGLRAFEVPSDFHGDIYGQYIAYDYYVGNTADPQPMQSNTGDIRITDGNKVLSVDFMDAMPHQVNGGWQTLYIKLDETATQGTGWRIGDMNTYTTQQGDKTLGNSNPTDSEIEQILRNVTGILIAPEGQNGSYYANGYGPEFIGVDNAGVYESLDEITIIEQGDEFADSDGDGVPDETDAYPDDDQRAFNNYTPGENTYATLAYEDLWPEKGDYDFNDLVIDYRFNHITNANNNVVEIKADFTIQAIGAGFENGFAFELPFEASKVQSVSGQSLESGYTDIQANGTEAGNQNAVIIVFENAYDIINSGGSFVNTIVDQEYVEPESISISIELSSPLPMNQTGTAPHNPFIIANSNRGYEVHLSGYEPTDLADESVFGESFDDTKPEEDKFYQSESNLPWAIHIPVSFDYPIEQISIEKAHQKFAEWAMSGGTEFPDWYEDNAGYRDESKIYQKP